MGVLSIGPHQGDALQTYFTQSRPEVCDLVRGRELRVLDLGCGGGFVGEELKRRGVAGVVHGVEIDSAAAAAAEARLDRVWVADLDGAGIDFVEPPYDAVIAADVLEHVRHPEMVLASIRGLLPPDGILVASVPNIRFVRVVAPLVLRGRFEYSESGVLDRTHLRFFTRSSLLGLLRECGFVVEVIRRAPMPWRRGWKAMAARGLGDFATEQFLVRARPARGS